jgi:hypothetical protein
MNARRTNRKRQGEAGIALLISIFVLLLISVVAIALVVSSGTESALAGNYRSSTGVYYAALSGLEEARGRLLSKNPDAFKTTDPTTFLPAPGVTLNMGDTYYLINPVGGETITPWDTSSTYGDNQFAVEFGPSGFSAPTNPSPKALSVWNKNPLQALNLPGPLYKWVRINAVSEKSLGVDADTDNLADATTPLYFDGVRFRNSSSAGPQVLELTSFAILPNGSQKLVQYLVVPVPITLPPFPAALTLAGSVTSPSATVGYSAPGSNAGFSIKGNDYGCNGSLTALPTVRAIGVLDSTDTSVVQNGGNVNGVHFTGIPSTYWSSYTGLPASTPPDIGTVNSSFSGSMTTPSGLNSVVQTIIQNADATVPTTSGSAERTFLSNLISSGAMSSTSPLTVVVNGDLDLTGWHSTGYGLLLVTGTFTYDPDASWDGIVMVVGKGMVVGSKSGSGEFDGAMFVAQTLDPSTGYTTVLPGSSLGNAFVDFNHDWSGTPFPPPAPSSQPPQMSMGGTGIRYSSCWIQKSQPAAGYKILSFHEISQ